VPSEHVGSDVVFDQAASHEEAQHAALDDSLDVLDVLRAEPSRLMEAERAVIALPEEAIEHHDMEVEVRIERTAEAVRERYSTERGIGRGIRAGVAQGRADGAQQDGQHGTRQAVGEDAAARRGDDAEELEQVKDPSGLPPIPVGGPGVWPIHAASGVGYGEGYAANAHRHAPDGWLPAVKYLVEELGADVNARDHNGYNAVHHTAARGDNELILYLVDNGADVMALSRRGQTTADMANGPVQRVSPFPETVALLEKLGSKKTTSAGPAEDLRRSLMIERRVAATALTLTFAVALSAQAQQQGRREPTEQDRAEQLRRLQEELNARGPSRPSTPSGSTS
jgi:hypothetical protein